MRKALGLFAAVLCVALFANESASHALVRIRTAKGVETRRVPLVRMGENAARFTFRRADLPQGAKWLDLASISTPVGGNLSFSPDASVTIELGARQFARPTKLAAWSEPPPDTVQFAVSRSVAGVVALKMKSDGLYASLPGFLMTFR